MKRLAAASPNCTEPVCRSSRVPTPTPAPAYPSRPATAKACTTSSNCSSSRPFDRRGAARGDSTASPILRVTRPRRDRTGPTGRPRADRRRSHRRHPRHPTDSAGLVRRCGAPGRLRRITPATYLVPQRGLIQMKTVVMTGGTAGFGAVAAKRISDTPNMKLILGARDTKNSSIDALQLDLARLAECSVLRPCAHEEVGRHEDRYPHPECRGAVRKHQAPDGGRIRIDVRDQSPRTLFSAQAADAQSRENATVVITTSDVHDPKMNPLGPKELDPETLAHPNDKGKGFIPGFRAYSSSKLCDLLTARAFEVSTEAQTNGTRVIAYNPGLTPDTSLYRAWPWWES